MTLQDLYRKFNKLMNDRGGTWPRITNLDRVPVDRVIDSWCEEFSMYAKEKDPDWKAIDEDPNICRQLCVTAMCIKIARRDGMSAAVMWKLQNG